MTNITIEEQHIGKNTTQHFQLHFLTNHISLAELIQCKAFQEAQQDKEQVAYDWNKQNNYFLSSYATNQQEVAIVEAESALAKTLVRFQNEAFLVVINGEQKTDLQEKLEVTEDMAIQFINW